MFFCCRRQYPCNHVSRDQCYSDVALRLPHSWAMMIDPVADHIKLVDYVLNCEKTAGIILGGGISKHYMLNAQIFREGFDYSIYISTAAEHDASDSGGNQEEAITWAKIKTNAPRVKVHAEASIVFPLLVAATFAN